jgi:transcriptional regulator with XRE-family HTH domain
MNEFLFNPKSPNDIAKELVEKIKQQRKLLKFSQIQLATKSGVSLGSIKRFESKYEISLNSLIKILIALNLEKDFENLFTQKSYNSIDEVINEQL